jgi:hypothetical protein
MSTGCGCGCYEENDLHKRKYHDKNSDILISRESRNDRSIC